MSNNNTINPEFDSRAVSVYGGDAMDDFPVLKAFQQYIDAEQAKARKRLLAMGIFFGVFMLVVVAIFVVLLVNVSNRNQQLNDRLVDFAMKERNAGSAVVVQPPQDSSAVLALTSKLEEMNRKISEAQEKADKAVAEAEAKARQAAAAAEASKPRPPSAEELEIQRLKKLLSDEKEKAAAEKARQREAELDAYRRKHYPELYVNQPQPQAAPVAPAAAAPTASAAPTPATTAVTSTPAPAPQTPSAPVATRQDPSRLSRADIDKILDDLDRIDQEMPLDDEDEDSADDGESDLKPINYFDATDDDEDEPVARPAKKKASAKKAAKAAAKKSAEEKTSAKKSAEKKPSEEKKASPKPPSQPVNTHALSVGKGDASETWSIPD